MCASKDSAILGSGRETAAETDLEQPTTSTNYQPIQRRTEDSVMAYAYLVMSCIITSGVRFSICFAPDTSAAVQNVPAEIKEQVPTELLPSDLRKWLDGRLPLAALALSVVAVAESVMDSASEKAFKRRDPKIFEKDSPARIMLDRVEALKGRLTAKNIVLGRLAMMNVFIRSSEGGERRLTDKVRIESYPVLRGMAAREVAGAKEHGITKHEDLLRSECIIVHWIEQEARSKMRHHVAEITLVFIVIQNGEVKLLNERVILAYNGNGAWVLQNR